ncbi:putative porin [Hyunsoonleella rubra]|uniref:Porin n=1 Tax=Hyunsoonleella rubra TaxID=1737062 RepID=A0ABW5TA91_9FLAO
MRKLGLTILFGVFSCVAFGQVLSGKQTKPQDSLGTKPQETLATQPEDSLRTSRSAGRGGNLLDRIDPKDPKEKKAKIEDYLIISHENDTTHVDTSLTVFKDYKFNYLRRDNFGLVRFSNIGQSYNSLTYNFQSTDLMPSFGARARHFNYMEIEDISYYRVPTPLSELLYKSAFEQGQMADSFFTVNTSPHLNFSIAYKGLRSLGKYQSILTSTGNFRFTTNYNTKNRRYKMRGHIVMQDLLNNENGGIRDDMVENFESGIDEFRDRSILEVNFENAENILKGKRFHLEHSYDVFNKKVKKFLPTILNDSTSKSRLTLKHIISFEDKYFQYDQTSANSIFGDAFVTSGLRERSTLEHLFNQVQLQYFNNELGDFQVNISNDNYNYGYDRVVVLNGNTITNRLKGNIYSAGGKYHKYYRGFDIHGEAGVNISGDFQGNFVKAHASYNFNDVILAKASINHSSKAPNYNQQLYQSNYLNYNWRNSFNNTETQQLAFFVRFKNIANVTVDYTTISDYIYFKNAENAAAGTQQIKAFQNDGTINYFRIKGENEIKFGKFALNNTILYQNVQDENKVLNVPELTTRNTIYFSSHVFKKAMFLQTGLTFNYFTKYYMNAYNPVMSEFYVQTDREFGDFPRFDFFVNAKIRQTRIFFKAEHFNSSFTGYDFYSAPNYPYRDFIVRFGIVWNFFM